MRRRPWFEYQQKSYSNRIYDKMFNGSEKKSTLILIHLLKMKLGDACVSLIVDNILFSNLKLLFYAMRSVYKFDTNKNLL